MTTSDRFTAGGESTGRSPSELRAVLLELGRLLKARHFFSPGDPPLTLVFERTARAWQGDLQRRGTLELVVEPKLIRTAHDGAPVISRELEELVQALGERGIRRLRFESDLEMEAFVAFVELLVRETDAIEREGGVERSLYVRAPMGIVINEREAEALLRTDLPAAPPAPAPAQPTAAAARPQTSPPLLRPAIKFLPQQAPVAPPKPVAALPPAPRQVAPAAPPTPPREISPELTMFGEAPETDPSLTMFNDLLDEAETDPDLDPRLTMFRDLPEPGNKPKDGKPWKSGRSPWGEAPARRSDRDSTSSSDPSALMADLGGNDALDLPGLDDLDFAFESEAPGGGALPVPPVEEDPTVPPAPDALGSAEALEETPAPTLPDDPLADLVPELGAQRDDELEFAALRDDELDLGGADQRTAEPVAVRSSAPEPEPAAADDFMPEFGSADDLGVELAAPDADAAALDADDDDLLERGSAFDAGDWDEAGEPPLEAGFDDPSPLADEGAVRSASAIERPGEDGRGDELLELLADLDDCTDDLDYSDLARRAAKLADALAAEGTLDVWHRTVDLMARHASAASGRTERQRGLADEQLGLLASEPRVADLLSRACSSDADAGITATTALMQLGPRVVPALLRAAQTEPDARRMEKLHGLLIAMADVVLPEIERRLGDRDPARVRAAVRVARELQSPALVPSLSALLGGGDASLRQEAAKALARIGDVAAIDALIAALGSSLPDVPNLAVFSLGATGNPRAVPALLHALREAIAAGNIEFAREAIRALGRLGRAEATRDLADLLLRRSLLNRRRFRELKLAAASALGQIPGDEAVGALAQAAQSRDPQLRRAAQTALERRAHLLASN